MNVPRRTAPARHGRAQAGQGLLMVFLSACPAVKRTTRLALRILIGAPVCGLRAVRALRCDVLNVPKPTKVIESPFFSAFVTPLKNESTAAAALLLLSAASFAMCSNQFTLVHANLLKPRVRRDALCW